MPVSKLFFITSVSPGLGRGFATAAIRAGHRVVGTLRKREDIAAFGRWDPERRWASFSTSPT